MVLLQTIASRAGFRDPATNALRTDAFVRLLGIARERAAEVVLMPGGYWSVTTEATVTPEVRRVADLADEAGIAVVAGIDVVTARGKGVSGKKGGLRTDLPYFGFVAGRASGERIAPRVWRQTSTTSKNAWDVPDESVPGRDRVVAVGGHGVGVLICGELFSPRARETLVALRPRLIIDLGHESMGTGVTRNLESMARATGCAVAHTHHVAEGGNASLHFVTPAGVRESGPIAECEWVGDDEFWVAWRIRQI